MRDAATALLLLLPSLAVVSSRLRSSRQDGDVVDDNDGEDMNIKMLRMSVPGEPGVSYPILSSVPTTSFSCVGKAEGGYYADVETGCQVVHTCGGGSRVVNRFSFIKYSTLCSNGTIYSQEMGTCHWWYLVDCESSEKYYFSQVCSIRTKILNVCSIHIGIHNALSVSIQNNIRVDSQSLVQSSSSSSGAQGQVGAEGGSSSFNSQLSVGGQSFALVPVGALPPIRFPGASGGFEINSNIINKTAFFLGDDINLADYLDEEPPTPPPTTTTTKKPVRPKPGFFEPRDPPKQLTLHGGKIMVED